MGNPPPHFPDLAERWLSFALNADPEDPGGNDYFGASFDFDWLVEDAPERAWDAINQVLEITDRVDVLGLLAAGPLEDLLSYHGDAFIERVEALARSNPRFAFLLGGVWRFRMSDENWSRVGQVANRDAWDDPRAEEQLGLRRKSG